MPLFEPGNSDSSLMRPAQGSGRRKNIDIIETYNRFLSMDRDLYATCLPKNQLEKMIMASINLAIAEPDSGEAHRIYNRLIGKPRETKISANLSGELPKSALAMAIKDAQAMFPSRAIIEVRDEPDVGIALQEPKRKPGRPPKRPYKNMFVPSTEASG